MWQRYSEFARRAVYFAQEEALSARKSLVGPEALLLGILRDDENRAVKILESAGISRDRVRQAISERWLPEPEGTKVKEKEVTLSDAGKRVLDLAHSEAVRQGEPGYVGTEFILTGIVLTEEEEASRILRELGVTIETVRGQYPRSTDREPAYRRPSAWARFLQRLRR